MNLNDLKNIDFKNLDYKKYLTKQNYLVFGGVAAFILVALAVIFVPILLGGSVQEQQQQVRQIAINDEATFQAHTKVFHITPFNDPQLEFEIRLPPNWELEKSNMEGNPELSKRIIGDIAKLRSPLLGTMRAYVIVQVLQLDHEIAAQHWLKNFILSNSYIIQGEVEGQGLNRATGSYTQIENNVLNYVSTVVQFNGSQAILTRFIIPNDLKENLGYLQKRSVESFKVAFLSDDTVEEQKVFTLADALKFTYPASWEISAPDFRDMNHLTVQLLNRNSAKSTEGFIRFLAVRRRPGTTMKDEIELLKEYFTATLKLTFTKLTSSQDQPTSDRFVFSRLEEYEVISEVSQNTQYVKMFALGGREWYIFTFLITPTAEADLYNWARNTRSFELIQKSIK